MQEHNQWKENAKVQKEEKEIEEKLQTITTFFPFYTKKPLKGFQSTINVNIVFSLNTEINLAISASYKFW